MSTHLLCGEFLVNELAGAVGVKIVGHVINLRLHVRAHLVERRRRDEVALAVDL